MDRLRHLLLLGLLLLNGLPLLAQQNPPLDNDNNIIDETVFIHTNATTFVSGETLYYKIYCLKASDKTLSTTSKVAYVELIDNNNNSLLRTKLFLDNSTGQGDYFVPTTFKTGNYKLIGYTSWMLNQSVSQLFQMDITIINPFEVNSAEQKNPIISDTLHLKSELKIAFKDSKNVASTKLQDLKLEINKNIFSNREKVSIKINPLTSEAVKGSYSLSVRKTEDLPTTEQLTANQFVKNTHNVSATFKNTEGQLVLPELRGEMISGKITSKNNSNQIQNIAVALSIPGKSFAFQIVKTNSDGAFIFNLNKAYYSPNITIQIVAENRRDYLLTVDSPSEIDYSKIMTQPSFTLTSDLRENILNRSIASQIENAYSLKKADTIVQTVTDKTSLLLTTKEYILDDFTRFKTLKETATEIATDINIKQEGQDYFLHVLNPDIYPQLQDPALVLIDGLLLQNANELINYKMKTIYKVNTKSGQYYYGPKIYNGVITFTTFNNDFISAQTGDDIIKPAIMRPLLKKEYYKIDHADILKNNRIPDFRNQLFWNPRITLENTEDSIEFYTSDVSGTFEIRLEGFSAKGTPVSIKEIIEVK
ncbi:hypothetical protein SAMN05443667_101374 [Flavobacterium gillisiae]|uniref:MG2 domain-containing protein n=1 Tax=Flavobacterium gillisiae TaxID=150146 RepID=A0A1H3X4M9_9FLAO|nr:hypothetical protein [Flavobacterium gillisiae]SDZ94213.1 hypothetical protein SAMN05443667_101374 [Flavobacterium gillisiae]